MEWLQNFYLGTHSHYQNITPRAASQPVRTKKRKIFLIFNGTKSSPTYSAFHLGEVEF